VTVSGLAFTGSAVGANSTAYQVNSHHSGYQADPALDPPFHRLWRRHLPDVMSYPLIVGDRVYVTVRNSQPPPYYPGTFLFALSRETGEVLWHRFLSSSSPWSALTAGGGRVYALNSNARMSAFGPATGKRLWSFQLPGQASSQSAPSYKQRLIYTAGVGTGQTVYAVTADGSVAWSQYTGATGQSAPAVGSDRVFESIDCPGGVFAYDRLTGHLDWHYPCASGSASAKTPAAYGGRVYARTTGPDDYVLDASSGALLDTVDYGSIPAFADGQGFQVLNNHQLQSFDVQTGTTNWTFTDPHAATGSYLSSAPMVVNDHVIIGASDGHLYALNAATGHRDWGGQPGSTIDPPDEWGPTAPLTGFAAGQGTLVVPAGAKLVAYGGS